MSIFASVRLIQCCTLVQQNKVLESKIQRRPSRMMVSKKSAAQTPATGSTLTVPSTSVAGTSASSSSALGSAPISTSLSLMAAHGPLIFLRVRVADTADSVHVSTTIPVYVCVIVPSIAFTPRPSVAGLPGLICKKLSRPSAARGDWLILTTTLSCLET